MPFRNIATLRNETKFASWLFTIIRRQAVRTARSLNQPANVSLDHVEAKSLPKDVDSWIENDHLLKLVAKLPEREQVLISLRFFDGHSFKEIAEITDKPLGTITKQTSRAIARLKSWMTGDRP